MHRRVIAGRTGQHHPRAGNRLACSRVKHDAGRVERQTLLRQVIPWIECEHQITPVRIDARSGLRYPAVTIDRLGADDIVVGITKLRFVASGWQALNGVGAVCRRRGVPHPRTCVAHGGGVGAHLDMPARQRVLGLAGVIDAVMVNVPPGAPRQIGRAVNHGRISRRVVAVVGERLAATGHHGVVGQRHRQHRQHRCIGLDHDRERVGVLARGGGDLSRHQRRAVAANHLPGGGTGPANAARQRRNKRQPRRQRVSHGDDIAGGLRADVAHNQGVDAVSTGGKVASMRFLQDQISARLRHQHAVDIALRRCGSGGGGTLRRHREPVFSQRWGTSRHQRRCDKTKHRARSHRPAGCNRRQVVRHAIAIGIGIQRESG